MPPPPPCPRRPARLLWRAALTLWLVGGCGPEEPPASVPDVPPPAPTPAPVAATTVVTTPAECDARALTRVLRTASAIPRPVRNQVRVESVSCDGDLAHAVVLIADEPEGASAFFRWNGATWRLLDLGVDCSRPPPGIDAERCRALAH